MIEKKIYSLWAFTNNENEKGKMNYLIYKSLAESPCLETGDILLLIYSVE